MVGNYRVVKTLIFVAVVSYFTYALYWFIKTIPYIVGISLRPENYSPPAGLRFNDPYSLAIAYLMDYVGFFGLTARVVGASYALLSAFLILRMGKDFFPIIRGKISKALLFEGIYFLSFIPSIYFLLGFSALRPIANFIISVQLFTQILLISPFLISLGIKVRKYDPSSGGSSLLRLAALSSMNYVIALWVTYILKWAEMAFADPSLFSFSPRILGLTNTVVTLTLSVVFAIVGFLSILRKSDGDKTAKWWGLSAIFLSLHFIIYVLYCASVGVLYYIQLSELWVIPLLGLGIYLILKRLKVKGISQIDQA
jgi:hypothetical protein